MKISIKLYFFSEDFMKRIRLVKGFLTILMACGLVMANAEAQTVLSRKVISARKAFDGDPMLAQVARGKYAVVWSAQAGTQGAQLFSRPVNVAGNTAGPIRGNLLGTESFRSSQHALAPLHGGGFLAMATRLTDRQLVLRFFDAALQPRGATVASGVIGYNPLFAQSGKRFLLINADGFVQPTVQSFVSVLNASGRKISDPIHVVTATPGHGFSATRLLASPAGGFVVAGQEYTLHRTDARASSFFVPAGLDAVVKPVAHESTFQNLPVAGDAAFVGEKALIFFGHGAPGIHTDLSTRFLGTRGQNAGAIKAFNPGEVTTSRFLRVISLTGLNKYLVGWEDQRNGFFFMQVLNANGTAVSEPFQLSPDLFAFQGPADLAWDAESQTLLAVWTQLNNLPPPDHSEIWFAAFKINQ